MTVPTAVNPGEEFDLFGRRWRVIGAEPRPRTLRSPDASDRGFVCRQVAPAQR